MRHTTDRTNHKVTRRGRPMFARFYARVAPAMDDGGVTEHRRALLASTSGRVLEVGAGTGANFPYYPAEVTEVIAVEPEPHLRHLAETAAAAASVPVTVIDGVAELLAAPDRDVDTVVACLMLCSVRDRDAALADGGGRTPTAPAAPRSRDTPAALVAEHAPPDERHCLP